MKIWHFDDKWFSQNRAMMFMSSLKETLKPQIFTQTKNTKPHFHLEMFHTLYNVALK